MAIVSGSLADVTLLDLPPHIVTRCLTCILELDVRQAGVLACVSKDMQLRCQEALSSLTQLGCAAKSWLPACTSTTLLQLSGRALSTLLPFAQRLRVLDLSHCFMWVDDTCLGTIAAHCAALQVLRLDHCCKVTAAGVQALGASTSTLAKLQELSLTSCGDIGEGSPLAGLPSLTDLSLQWCYCTTSAAVTSFGGSLKRLVLHGCDMVKDEVCSALPRVEHLNLAFLNITDAGLQSLAAGSPQLRRLTLASKQFSNLWSCGLWTEAGIATFRAARPDVAVDFIFS